MAKYSRLNQLVNNTITPTWNNIALSDITRSKRQRLKSGIDDFASFSWRGIDAFENFGAFIVNKRDLKFNNGPTFSNEYTKPQFESAYGQLMGVTFNIQKIDFTIGVYWISEKHYRQLIYWLNPYEINTLTFGFEPNYYYQVKLASIENGTRYIIGREGKDYMYYTEMKLSFEIQGPACAYASHGYEFETIREDSEGLPELFLDSTLSEYSEKKDSSDLPTPIEVLMKFNFYSNKETITADDDYFTVHFSAQYDQNDEVSLFTLTLKNQTYAQFGSSIVNSISIKYESDSSLILLNMGDSDYTILTKLTTSSRGQRIVSSIDSKPFEIPGIFDDPAFDIRKLHFKTHITSGAFLNLQDSAASLEISDLHINARARTNLI